MPAHECRSDDHPAGVRDGEFLRGNAGIGLSAGLSPLRDPLLCRQRADPVVPLVSRLIAAHPRDPCTTPDRQRSLSSNPKLNNVAKGWAAAEHVWVVMADSNVLLPPDYLRRLFGNVAGDTGLVSSPAIGCRPDGIWAELECAFLNTYQARWQCFADSVGLGFAQGKTMMYRKELIEAAGGIRALAAELAEDAASTKIVRSLGLRVRVVDRPISQPLGRRTAAEVWHRQIRWARLRRNTFMLYFLPELLAGGVAAACGVRARGCLARFADCRDARRLRWPSGTAPRPSSPSPRAGMCPGDRRSLGCCATSSFRFCGWRAGRGTTSSGVTITMHIAGRRSAA